MKITMNFGVTLEKKVAIAAIKEFQKYYGGLVGSVIANLMIRRIENFEPFQFENKNVVFEVKQANYTDNITIMFHGSFVKQEDELMDMINKMVNNAKAFIEKAEEKLATV